MGAKKLEKFGGMLPAWEAHLLPDGQAVNASNAYLFSGQLDGWRVPTLLRQLTNPAAKFAYRLPTLTEAVAFAYFVLLSQPNAGDNLTLGEDTYTWVSSINSASAAFSVLIGASATASATNLLNAFTFDNGAGTHQGITYGNNTVVNGAIATSNGVGGSTNAVLSTGLGPAVFVIAPDFGASYNTTIVSESTGGVRTIWLYSPGLVTYTTTTFTGGVNVTFNSAITSSSQFLEFLDPDTNVVKSQVVADQFERYYIASPSTPPAYNTRNRITAGSPTWALGINPPGCAPAISVNGGGNYGTLGITATAAGVSSVFVNANTMYLFPVVPTGATQIIDVGFIPNVTDPNVLWQTVVYLDVSGGGSPTPTAPGALLSASPVFQGLVANTNSLGAFTNPPAVNAFTPVWIGFMMNTTENFQGGDASSVMVSFPETFGNGPPVNAGSPLTTGLPDVAIWMDYSTQDVLEARAYVYTWVSAYGEESAPSPFTLVNGWSNGTWTIGLFSPPVDDVGILRNLAIARLYRTVTGQTGLTTYYQLADISLGSTNADAIAFVNSDQGCLSPNNTYTDIVSDAVLALSVQLPSTNYFPPPSGLVGFLNMPNGVIAAWRKNEIWFCEPYFPHAWPPAYAISTDFPIVGLGLTSGAVVACSSATPYVAAGVRPGQMSLYKCSKPEPCTSRGSIVSLDSGVLFISPNGLIQVTSSGQLANSTEGWIKKEDWAALVPQKNTRAIALASTYFCWGTTSGTGATADTSVAQIGFNIELTADSSSFSIWPQPGGHRIGFMPMTTPLGYNIDNVFIDPWTGQGVLLMNGQEYWYDFTNTNPIVQPYDWLSKKYQGVNKKNYSAMRIFCTVPASTPPQNPNPNTAAAYDLSWQTLQTGQWGIIKVWADPDDGSHQGNMVLVMARELTRNGQVMRLPSGYKSENFQVEVLARVRISNIQIATSVQELGEV
jgi:hypothetical protein